MENEVTESTETVYNESEATDNLEDYEGQDIPTQDDNSFDADYKDDFEVPTDGSEEEEFEDYSQEEINDAMMDYIKENYEMPDKFKDVESLINSYKHLESKMGNMKGSPDTYELDDNIIDGMDEGILDSIVPAAAELGIDNDGLNTILHAAMQGQQSVKEANWVQEKGKLGIDADAQINNALGKLNANFPPEVSEAVQGMIQTAEDFKALQAIMDFGMQQSAPTSSAPVEASMSDEKLTSMLHATDSYGNLKMETDSQYASKVNGIMKQFWG